MSAAHVVTVVKRRH